MTERRGRLWTRLAGETEFGPILCETDRQTYMLQSIKMRSFLQDLSGWLKTVSIGILKTILTLWLWRILLPYGYSYKASCARPVKLSFVIFDIRALWRSGLTARVHEYKKLQMTA